MSNVIIYDPNEVRQESNSQLLRETGYAVVTSQGLQEALDETMNGQGDLLVLGLDEMRPEDSSLWSQVRDLTDTAPVIALHNHPSQEMYEIAARMRIAAILPNSVSGEVFVYAVGQVIQQQAGHTSPNQIL